MDKSLDEIRELWEKETDNYLVKAATINLEGYPLEVQDIIKKEVQRRGLEGVEFCKSSIGKEIMGQVVGKVFNPEREGYIAKYLYVSKAMLPVIIFFETSCGALGVYLGEMLKKLFYKYKEAPEEIIYRKKVN